MTDEKKGMLRVEANYACVQSSFWGSYCTLSAFTAVYMAYRGLSDTQIGLTGSLMSALAIVLQAALSNFSDHHMSIPIKRIISAMFLLAVCLVGVYSLLPLPVALLILVYSAACACNSTNSGLLNAQLMQFNNVGIPVRYGWPRGCGSIVYAALAWLYGILAEEYTPAILPKIYIGGTLVCILFVMLMPDPYKGKDMKAVLRGARTTTYREMLRGNRPLVMFLIGVMFYGIGQTAGYTFTIRVIQRLGGGTAEFGLSEFMRAGVEMPMLFLSPLLLKKLKPKALMAFSVAMFGMRNLAVNFAPSLGLLYAACTLNMFCSGIYIFAAVILANQLVRMTEKVRAQSLTTLCACLGSIIGNAYAGWMLERIGLTPMMVTSAGFCFLGAVIIAVLCHPEQSPE